MKKFGWLGAMVVFGGCGDEAKTPTSDTADTAQVADTAEPADLTGEVGADVDGVAEVVDVVEVVDPAPNPLGVTHTFAIDPITVEPGEERQVCRTLNVPAGAGLDVVRFASRMRGISHHFNLYKVIDGTRFDPVTADEAATRDCSPAAEQLRGDAAYIYGSATPDRVMETPAGVAFRLEPGQRLILEFHAINYTLDPIEANVEVDLVTAAEGAVIEHHADIMWFANWGFRLPPGEVTSDTASCEVPYEVEVFGLMSHFHELGRRFEIEATIDGESRLVYEDEDWAHPAYAVFDPPLALGVGDSLDWTCTWDNTRDSWVFPNKGSKDEMCMVFAAAYPKVGLSAEPIQCNLLF